MGPMGGKWACVSPDQFLWYARDELEVAAGYLR